MMAPSVVSAYFAGAIAMGFLVAAAFFLRFWRRSREGLFGVFAIAFALMALNQSLPVLLQISSEAQGGLYLLRLLAFVLIILAIVLKNLRRPGR